MDGRHAAFVRLADRGKCGHSRPSRPPRRRLRTARPLPPADPDLKASRRQPARSAFISSTELTMFLRTAAMTAGIAALCMSMPAQAEDPMTLDDAFRRVAAFHPSLRLV